MMLFKLSGVLISNSSSGVVVLGVDKGHCFDIQNKC